MKKDKNKDIRFLENEKIIINLKKKVKELEKINNKMKSEKDKIAENEMLLNQFFYQCPAHLFIKDQNLKVVKLSRSFEKMFGIPANLVVGKKMAEIFPPEFAKKITSDDKKILKTNKAEELIEEYNGDKYITIKFPLRLKDRKNYLAGLTIDFSDYFIEYEALLDSRERYRVLLELAVDGILIGSKDGFIIDANSTICMMTGRSRDELIGMHITKSFFSDECTKKIPFRFDELRKGKVVVNERIILRPDGSLVPVEMRTKMMPDGTFQSIYRDITERKKFENDLMQLNADKDRFISILSHDLKSPFNSLIALSKLLNNNFECYDKEKIESFLKQFTKSAQSTYELMEDILDWARAQSGKMKFKPQFLTFYNLCADIFDSFNCSHDSNNVKFVFKGQKDLLVYADPDMLKTILRNLISNAVKFIQERGKVNISAVTKRNNVLISVKDNGIGIEPDDLKKLFDVMSVRTVPDAKGEKGTGFGLLLCKDFVEKHNGKIWVESKPGKGSQFYFLLPLP